jgi:hypothetical protein
VPQVGQCPERETVVAAFVARSPAAHRTALPPSAPPCARPRTHHYTSSPGRLDPQDPSHLNTTRRDPSLWPTRHHVINRHVLRTSSEKSCCGTGPPLPYPCCRRSLAVLHDARARARHSGRQRQRQQQPRLRRRTRRGGGGILRDRRPARAIPAPARPWRVKWRWSRWAAAPVVRRCSLTSFWPGSPTCHATVLVLSHQSRARR